MRRPGWEHPGRVLLALGPWLLFGTQRVALATTCCIYRRGAFESVITVGLAALFSSTFGIGIFLYFFAASGCAN
jgi:hypothetical protein